MQLHIPKVSPPILPLRLLICDGIARSPTRRANAASQSRRTSGRQTWSTSSSTTPASSSWGPRPSYSPRSGTVQRPPAAPLVEASSTAEASAWLGYKWSDLIDADTIETEIKRHVSSRPAASRQSLVVQRGRISRLPRVLQLARGVVPGDRRLRRPGSLAGRGGEGLAQLYGRAGANCKVGTDQSYREVATPRRKTWPTWSAAAGRRFPRRQARRHLGSNRRPDTFDAADGSTSLEERLSPNASDGGSFRKNSEDLRHEAQLMAVMAEIIANEDYDYADDESYHAHAASSSATRRSSSLRRSI